MTSPRISVIVPAKNEGHRIANALRALRLQTIPAYEILVVDGHSEDGTAEIARSLGARVVFEEHGTRAGACQVGVEAAHGEFVAFTDADCIPDARWLETLVSRFTENCVGVGGSVLNEGDSFWQRAIDAALDTPLGSANSIQGRRFAATRAVYSISGSNSLYRHGDLIAIGGFRTELVTAEDTELNTRLRRRGTLLYVPNAIVHHRHERGVAAFAKRMYQYGFGRGQVMRLGAPVVLPLAAAVFPALAIEAPAFSLALLLAYGALLLLSALPASIKAGRPPFLLALPVVYVVEHSHYVAGFWAGVAWRLTHRRPRAQTQPGAGT